MILTTEYAEYTEKIFTKRKREEEIVDCCRRNAAEPHNRPLFHAEALRRKNVE